jgi:hypothetical protein
MKAQTCFHQLHKTHLPPQPPKEITIIIVIIINNNNKPWPQTVGSNPDVYVINDAKYRMETLSFQHMKRKFL